VSVLQLPRVTTPPIDPGNGTLRDPLAVEIVEGGRGLQARVQPIDVDLARKLAAEGADPSDGSGETQEERLRLGWLSKWRRTSTSGSRRVMHDACN
jgi:hypothetical protein